MSQTGTGVARKTPVVPVIGALAVILASFLPWLSGQEGVSGTNAFDVPFNVLTDPTAAASSDLKLGIAVLVVGLAAGAATIVPALSAVRRVLGLVAIAIGIVFFVQISRLLDQAGGGVSVSDLIGIGAYATIGGGLLLLLAKGR